MKRNRQNNHKISIEQRFFFFSFFVSSMLIFSANSWTSDRQLNTATYLEIFIAWISIVFYDYRGWMGGERAGKRNKSLIVSRSTCFHRNETSRCLCYWIQFYLHLLCLAAYFPFLTMVHGSHDTRHYQL